MADTKKMESKSNEITKPSVQSKDDAVELNIGKWLPTLVLVIIGLWIATSAFAVVDAGNVGIQSTFGKIDPQPLDAGIHLKLPWVSIISMNYQVQKYDAKASAASSDLQDVSGEITVNYHLNKNQAVDVYQTNGLGYADKVIPQAVQESVKAVTAKFSAEQLITSRETVRSGIETSLRDKLAPYGLSVEAVSITNFDFSPSFNAAIEAKVTAQQKALEAENVLKQVEFEAQQTVARAKGLADANILQANADANALLVVAEAQAQALLIQNQALAKNQDVLKLRLIEKWDGHYPQYYWVGSEGSALVQVPSLPSSGGNSNVP